MKFGVGWGAVWLSRFMVAMGESFGYKRFIMILLSSAWGKGDRKTQPKPRMTNLQTVKVNSSPH